MARLLNPLKLLRLLCGDMARRAGAPEVAPFEWTMAAHVDFTNTGFTRLFSSFKGTGAIDPNRMILDMDPSGSAINYLRVFVGPEKAQAVAMPEGQSEPGYKHLALTYDDGEIAVYLDGAEKPNKVFVHVL